MAHDPPVPPPHNAPTDPVLAALDRARRRPPVPSPERELLIAYANRVKEGPYLTTEEFTARVVAMAREDGVELGEDFAVERVPVSGEAEARETATVAAIDRMPVGRPLTRREAAALARAEVDIVAGRFSPGEEVSLRVALRVLREAIGPALAADPTMAEHVAFLDDAMTRAAAYIHERRLWKAPALRPVAEAAGDPPDEDAALDAIYDEADDAFLEGRFADIDAKLAAFDPASLGTLRSLAWLSISTAARPHLPSFDTFCDRVAAHVRATNPAQAEALLRGLVPVTASAPSAEPPAGR